MKKDRISEALEFNCFDENGKFNYAKFLSSVTIGYVLTNCLLSPTNYKMTWEGSIDYVLQINFGDFPIVEKKTGWFKWVKV